MAVLPPIRVTGMPPLAQSHHEHRRHLIDFCHPGYSYPHNILFRLCAIEPANEPSNEPERLGVHHETARIACAILTNNTWDGFLTADTPDGPAVPLDDPDCILTADRYYFHHPSDPKYPVVADFESWKFPTSTPGQLPSYWRSLAIPPPQIPQSTPARCCAVTGRHIPVESAHLIPVSQTEWFNRNGMDIFQEQMGQDNINWIKQTCNKLSLARDIHYLADQEHLVFVPRAYRGRGTNGITTYSNGRLEAEAVALVCYTLNPDPFYELTHLYHLHSLEPLEDIPAEYIFANFAHAIFRICVFFRNDGRQRKCVQLEQEVGQEPQYKIRDNPERKDPGTLSRSPTKRRGTYYSSPEKRSRSNNEDGSDGLDALVDSSFSSEETISEGSHGYEDEAPRGRTLKRRRTPQLDRSPSWSHLNTYESWYVTEERFPVIVDDHVHDTAAGQPISGPQETLQSPSRKRLRTSV
ncbi:hypothetical protein diail_11625 [Diaporthe ilicicola]|nr:hypothetical protein diail_11625 [Diaporthe ilicicola]